MGSSLHTHVGPYMIVRGKKTILKKLNISTCSNDECYVSQKQKTIISKFCSECGAQVINKDIEQKQEIPAAWDITDKEEFVDELCYISQSEEVFISNKKSPFDREKMDNPNPYQIVDLMNVNMTEEIKWFENRFKKIIDYAEQEFGEGSVIIKWGIIQWWW